MYQPRQRGHYAGNNHEKISNVELIQQLGGKMKIPQQKPFCQWFIINAGASGQWGRFGGRRRPAGSEGADRQRRIIPGYWGPGNSSHVRTRPGHCNSKY